MPSRSRDFVINIKTKYDDSALKQIVTSVKGFRDEIRSTGRSLREFQEGALSGGTEVTKMGERVTRSAERVARLGSTASQSANDVLDLRDRIKGKTGIVEKYTAATEEATKATVDFGDNVEGTAASLASLVTVKRYAIGAWKTFRTVTKSSTLALTAWGTAALTATIVAIKLASNAEDLARVLKEVEYQTGQSAGSIAQIQRHLEVYGDEVELLTRALQGDEAATRELIARNKEFDDVLRRLTLSSAEFAALDTEGRIQAIAYQLNLSTREAEQLNDEIRDLSDQDAFDPTEWEKLKQEIGDTLSGLGDDASDIGEEIGNRLLDGIAVAITGGEEAPEDSANWLERRLGLDTDVEGAIQPTVDTVTTMSTHLSEALSNSAVGTTSGSWWQNIVATQQEQEELDALSGTLDHLWDRLGAVEDRREAVKNATRWVKENGEAVGIAARAAAGGIALLGKSFDAIKPDTVTRMGLVASAMERLGLTGADIIDNPRLSKLLTDTVTGLGVAAVNEPGIGSPAASVPVQGQSGVVDDPDDNDVYDHNYPTDVLT